MFLVIFLLVEPRVEVLDEDVRKLTRNGEQFSEYTGNWVNEKFFLGFYDWLRTTNDRVIGLNLTLHQGREGLSRILPARKYLLWEAPYVLRILLEDGTIDEVRSVDQEFAVSRCFRSPSGAVALLFDASELTDRQIRDLQARRG
jgi:hypothetical protein